jgi:DNA-binding response OmpR family regulator
MPVPRSNPGPTTNSTPGTANAISQPIPHLFATSAATSRRTRPPVAEVIDTRTREVQIAGRQARLPKKEYLLLAQLASDPEHVFTHHH